jgi:hypothetical protein
MAKRRTLPKTTADVAAALGTLAKRVDTWKQQRNEIGSELRKLSAVIDGMLEDLGTGGGSASTASSTPSRRRGGRPRGYRASAATRAKLRAAWAKRKAAKGAAKPARTISAEGRERIAAAQRKRWAEARKKK